MAGSGLEADRRLDDINFASRAASYPHSCLHVHPHRSTTIPPPLPSSDKLPLFTFTGLWVRFYAASNPPKREKKSFLVVIRLSV
ncbi:hypothetical protein E2C01_021173 [Portunus trituberculatus]|uniref:Uncharacterized protein n=1 Tax=Portunus trituberculatus TaxID=210409 RepID=A0A5B7E202_PORTR|nr:hypothetical protein [Portunus trituberculatus]